MKNRTYAEGIAAEVRAEIARQKKSGQQLASLLGVTQSTASRRMTGEVPFDVAEIYAVAEWLGVTVGELDRRASELARTHAGTAA